MEPDPTGAIDEAVRLHDRAAECMDAGDLVRAEALARDSLDRLSRRLGTGHPDVANVLSLVAEVRARRGDFAGAEPDFRRAVAALEADFGEDLEPDTRAAIDRFLAAALGGLGNVLRILGRYAEAERVLDRALALAESLGPDDEQVATTLNLLGMLHKYQARFDDAEQRYRRAAGILEALHGPDDPRLASLCHNLGGLDHERGRFAEGEPWARRALAIRLRTRGPRHRETAAELVALGGLLDGQGRQDESEPMYVRAADILEADPCGDPCDLAVCLNNLAVVRAGRGDAPGAETLFHRAIALKQRALGTGHPDVAMSLNNLGTLYLETGRPDEARVSLARALDICEAVLGSDHPRTRTCRENLALAGAGSRSTKG